MSPLVADEINDLTDQLGESGRKVMEMEKAYKRLEMERVLPPKPLVTASARCACWVL